MSRLDSAIRRLQAQRACLDLAVATTAGLGGPILELGLGNGRTYDHLRENFPGREIYVFEREVRAHRDCVPAPEYLFLGNLQDTLPAAAERFGRTIPLVHVDIGSGNATTDREVAGLIAGWLPDLLCSGGLVIADQDVRFESAEEVPLPEGVRTGRYFLYRRAA